ncbi:MAG: hypothetical protein ACYTGB_11170 [Planctomycetota bacterium]|jgi:hypothetical protein
MADTASCDRCGADLLGADVRYVAEMKIWAAYDVMELGTRRGLQERDLHSEYVDALIDAARQSEQEAMDSVYWQRKFDLCAKCRKELQADPLGAGGERAGEEREEAEEPVEGKRKAE